MTELESLVEVRAAIATLSDGLDPDSRYISELYALVDSCADTAELEERLSESCRGRRHAGSEAFSAMSLLDKLRANLITPETSLFRFAEGELEASRAVLQSHGSIRVLIVPCSHGEEAFTMASFLLAEEVSFSIRAFDVQQSLLNEARTGRLTFGYPLRYLRSPGYVSGDVLERISFEHGDAFDLPLADDDIFDLVLCRNFIGYFVPSRARELTACLAARVAPGGRLFLDTFCLGKMRAVGDALAAASMSRVGKHPVFSRET